MPDNAAARSKTGKRAFDILAAILGLVALAPVWLVIALLLQVTMGSPVLFRQTRPGVAGKPFEILKFRTMSHERNDSGALLPDAQRLTRLGAFLRATSLDELPELLNVLRGDMSLVGPRPLLMRYLPYFTEEESRRHEVRPGITGLAQTSGRNFVSWDERLALDVQYVDNWSFAGDIRIILRTVVQVFRREGVAVDSAATMRDLDEERATRVRDREPGGRRGG